MSIRIGELIAHGGEQFVIVNIKHEQTVNGMILVVTAFDSDMASREQQKAIKVEQTQESVVDLIKKIAEQGGGGLGFNIGGV
jgi:hypothetical protein